MDSISTNNHKEPKTDQRPNVFDRLEHLGYQCIKNKCDKYTTLRISPLEKVHQQEKEEVLETELA